MDDLISRLSELRCQYNCFDENERNAYHTLSEAIKALSDIPDTNIVDTINRQAAIRWVKTECNPYGKPTLEYESGKKVIEHLEQMPSAEPEPQWIPCSERLPEDIRPVIVTWKNTDPASYYQYIVGKHYTGTACFKNGKWYWYSSVTEDMLSEYGRYDLEEFDEAIECIAWMPLPEPWKGGGEDGN